MKKIYLFFAILIFLAASCSSGDDEKTDITPEHDGEETSDSAVTDSDITDDENDTAPASDDDNGDSAHGEENDTADPGNDSGDSHSDEDSADSSDDSGDSNSDEDSSDSTDDSDTGTGDDDQDIIIPDIPVVFGNICTGQKKCYDETAEISCPNEGTKFFGQDANYAKLGKCIPQKFTVKGSGKEKIVFDENLKLEWQQKVPEGEFDWQSAENNCKKEYAGSYGWRLPTPKELLSIVDNGRYDPAINTEYFPDTQNEQFWTSADFVSTESYDSGKAWFVSFDKGFLSHEKKTESKKMHVRCVRGTPLPDGNFKTEKIGGDEVVKDSVTALMWQKRELKDNVDEIGSFEAALSYCEKLTYAGFSDWRLPNKNELATLADYGKYHPASAFPGMTSRSFRTSTSDAKKSDKTNDWKNAWYVTFYEGIVNLEGKSTGDFVRCVRNSLTD